MDPRRLVDVRAGTDAAAKHGGSGYLIGPHLILTARHAVTGPDGQPWTHTVVRIGHPVDGEVRRASARLCWPAAGRHGEHDVALLRLDATDAVEPPGPPVRWGRLTGTEAAQYTGMGFPRFAEYDAHVRGVEQLSGVINPLSTGLDGGYVLDQRAAPDPARGEGRAWSGVSGAPIFCGRFLVGLVTRDDELFRNRRLHATPAGFFASDPEFVRLVREDTAVPPFLESVELAGLFAPWVEAAPAGTPGSLLAAAVEATDFYGRDDIFGELAAWRDDPRPFSVTLISGEGGQGKTRLGREFIRRSRADGWVAGFSAAPATGNSSGIDLRFLTDHVRRLRTGTSPVLLVVDYAETQPDFVAGLATDLLHEPPNRPVRLLLLARTPGSWWDDLREVTRGRGTATTKTLAPLTTDPDTRTQAYRAAVKGLAGLLPSLPEPAVAGQSAEPWPVLAGRLIDEPPPLDDARYDNALNLHMAALLDLIRLASGAEWLPADDPEEILVRHERDYWKRVAHRRGLLDEGKLSTLSDPSDRAKAAMGMLDRAVAGAVLLGPCTVQHARAIGALASVNRAGDVIGWLHALYPPANGDGLGQVQPDRLAEFLLGRILGEPEQADLLPRIGRLAPDFATAYPALLTLVRTAAHPPFTGRVGPQIVSLIAAQPHAFGKAIGPLRRAIMSRQPAGRSPRSRNLLRGIVESLLPFSYVADPMGAFLSIFEGSGAPSESTGLNLAAANPYERLVAYVLSMNQLGHLLIENGQYAQAVRPLMTVIIAGRGLPRLSDRSQDVVRQAVAGLAHAYARDPEGVADEFQQATGHNISDLFNGLRS